MAVRGEQRLPAGARSRFRHYASLQRTEPRARRLLRRFRFAPIRDALQFANLPAFDARTPDGFAGAGVP